MNGLPQVFRQAHLGQFDAAARQALGDPHDNAAYFLTGPAGTGKTHLAAAIMREWAQEIIPKVLATRYCGQLAYFRSAPDIMRELRASMNGGADVLSEYALTTEYRTVGAFILDDLGAEKATEWTFTALYTILSARLDNLRKTVVTSNLSLKELDDWEPRIASRLGGMRVIILSGRDRRLERK